MSELLRPLEKLSPIARHAFTAGCVERAIVVYELEGFGDSQALLETAETLWGAALGEIPDIATAELLERRVGAVTPSIDDDPDHEASALAGMAVIHAARSLVDPGPRATARCAQMAVACWSLVSEGNATRFEEQWQEQAIEVLRRPGITITRNIFAGLPPPPRHLHVPNAR